MPELLGATLSSLVLKSYFLVLAKEPFSELLPWLYILRSLKRYMQIQIASDYILRASSRDLGGLVTLSVSPNSFSRLCHQSLARLLIKSGPRRISSI
jgi:hypothetical protein